MSKKIRATSNAIEILKQRYIKEDADRKASLQAEHINAEVAKMIFELRSSAGLSQKELAEIVGTTQSVVSRLEDADYAGHSLSMLSRIAKALNQRLKVSVEQEEDQKNDTVKYVFRELIKGLRRKEGLGINEFSKKTGISRHEVIAMERRHNYRPAPLTLHKLSKFYKISQQKLACLAGAIKNIPHDLQQEASSFAAKSESFSNLTNEEKRILDNFVKFMKSENKK